jgi:hypothetical protein
MTGVNSLLTDLKPYTARFVTFGGGAKAEIKGA